MKQCHERAASRQPDGGLACGIAAADEHDFTSRTHLGFQRGGPVPDAAAFEFGEVRYVGSAIAGSAGNHDRARAHLASIAERHGQFTVPSLSRAGERRGLRRNQDLSAKLLCLHEGAPGKRLTRDAGRKAKVIFDSRACTRLSAERSTVEHNDAQAFRGGVNGGRKPGGSRAHDSNVEEFVPRAGIEHAQAASEGLFGWVEEHGTVGADDQDRALRRAVLFEHGCSRVVMLGINNVMRVAVSLEESLEAKHLR